MNKTKRVLSVVLAVLMLSSLIAALAIAADDDVCNVVINYVFADSRPAANSWTARISKGESINQTVTSPTVVGYAPNQETVTINQVIDDHVTITVTYQPVEVDFTVKHYQQNVNDDKYILAETEPKKAFTESQVGDKLAKEYNGFTALLYDTTTKVAADGSTVVEIYYDRNYYLMSFNLNGGFGVEPIYARYGASVKVENPTKPGYTFNGWEPTVPETVPAENTTYKAKWKVDDSVNYRVQYWQENANDDGFSYESSVQKKAAPGTVITAANDKNYTGFHYDHTDGATVAADGSSVVNVYYKRNTYTLTFKVNEGFIFDNWVTKAEFKNIKYGADTSPWWNQAPSGYLWHTTSSGSTFYTAAPDMPNSNLTIYGKKSSGMSTIHYYEKGTTTSIKPDLKVQNSEWSFTVEDYIEIPGFKYDSNKVQGNNYYLYYTRTSYKLDFNSANVIVRSNTIPYDKALSSYYFEPSYPTGILEEGGYVFAGWYTDPGCTEAVAWDTAKMPYNNTIFYAKWAPKNHTVRTFLTKEKIEEGVFLETYHVPHGTAVPSAPANPTNGNYTFVGWFYEENGVEKAFDFSMPIVKDLNLYAKWSSNTLVAYTIKYVLEKDGTTVIADETTGSALAGTTKTFEAKGGEELNEGYQTGFFPETNSHSIDMQVEGGNEFTFVYVAKDKVNYTVKYLEKDTNKVLHDEKTAETTHAIITEKFEQINGYAPDAYQKRLVLSATEEENVIIFWYTEDNIHAPVHVIHWLQDISGNGYTQKYQETTDLNGVIGNHYTENPLEIPGFTYNAGMSKASGTLTKDGLELNLYYDRNTYDYEFRFVDRDGNPIEGVDTVTGKARYQAQVTERAKKLEGDGWMLDTTRCSENGAINIVIEKQLDKNVYTFYYLPFYNIVHVKSGVAGDPVKTVIPNNNKDGLTDKVSDGYLYGGTFDNVDCTTVHDFGEENAINFTPVKGEKYYIWEVSETYLKPRTYAIWRHDPNNNGRLNVVGLYLMTHADRLNYQFVGFEIVGENATFANKEVYEVVNAKKGDTLYQQIYVNLQGEMAVSNAEVAVTDRKDGYIAMHKLSEGQFATFVDKGLTFQPYWVTLDGIIVRGVNSRECRYKGPDNRDITVNNKDRIGSSVSNFATPSQQTVEAVSYYAFEAADVEVATPDVPETPEIPEVPEAPEMTLNVTPYYVALDGTTVVYGETRTLVYRQWVGLEG